MVRLGRSRAAATARSATASGAASAADGRLLVSLSDERMAFAVSLDKRVLVGLIGVACSRPGHSDRPDGPLKNSLRLSVVSRARSGRELVRKHVQLLDRRCSGQQVGACSMSAAATGPAR